MHNHTVIHTESRVMDREVWCAIRQPLLPVSVETADFPVTSMYDLWLGPDVARVGKSHLILSALTELLEWRRVICGSVASSRLSYKRFTSIVPSFWNPHSRHSMLPIRHNSRSKRTSTRGKSMLQSLPIDQTQSLSVIQLAAMKNSLLTGRDKERDFCKCQLDPNRPSPPVSPPSQSLLLQHLDYTVRGCGRN